MSEKKEKGAKTQSISSLLAARCQWSESNTDARPSSGATRVDCALCSSGWLAAGSGSLFIVDSFCLMTVLFAPTAPGDHVYRLHLKAANGKYLSVEPSHLIVAKSELGQSPNRKPTHLAQCWTLTSEMPAPPACVFACGLVLTRNL